METRFGGSFRKCDKVAFLPLGPSFIQICLASLPCCVWQKTLQGLIIRSVGWGKGAEMEIEA